MKRKYLYKNLEVTPYWNGYRVWYKHENGARELLGFQMTKADAKLLGKGTINWLNGLGR